MVWIDSVIDMVKRRKEMKLRLKEIVDIIETAADHSAEFDYSNEKIELEDNLPKIEEGLNYELSLIKIGTEEFFKNKLHHNLLENQLNYISK